MYSEDVDTLWKQLADYENIIAALQQENEELTDTLVKQRDTILELRGGSVPLKTRKTGPRRSNGGMTVEPPNPAPDPVPDVVPRPMPQASPGPSDSDTVSGMAQRMRARYIMPVYQDLEVEEDATEDDSISTYYYENIPTS